MKKFILYASAFVVFLALVGWLIYPINLVVYASVLGTVTVILLIKTNERREEAITKIVGSSLRRTIFRSVRYTWITIIGLNVLSLVVVPWIAYNFFTDASLYIGREFYCGRPACTPHTIDENDITRLSKIKYWVELAEEFIRHPPPCVGYLPCVNSASSTLKVYEAYAVRDMLELNEHKELRQLGQESYYGQIEYNGHYYWLDIRIPPREFGSYWAYGLVSFIGSAAIALAWVGFGQSNNKQRDVVQA